MVGKSLSFSMRPWGLLSAATAIACVSTAVGFWGRLWWPFDLGSHFRAQYFFFFLASGIIFLLGRKKKRATLCGVFAIINLSLIVPLYFGASVTHGGVRTFRALLINVAQSAQAYEEVPKFIRSVEPDFMILVEVNQAWINNLQKMQTHYPFSIILPDREGRSGIALLSRIPLESGEVGHYGEAKLPTVVARFEIDGQLLTVIGTHALAPWGPVRSEYRNQHLAALAQIVGSQKGSVVVLGDLNTTSWSPFFRDLLRKTGLRDSRKGFGLQPTWPTGFPPLWIPIDHCLVSSRVVVHDRRIGPQVGSDHYPVVVDFSVE